VECDYLFVPDQFHRDTHVVAAGGPKKRTYYCFKAFMPPSLYRYPFSANAQKVLLARYENKLEFAFRQRADKTPQLLETCIDRRPPHGTITPPGSVCS
jgi:hypothetical protein